jgi:hypothetical protein
LIESAYHRAGREVTEENLNDIATSIYKDMHGQYSGSSMDARRKETKDVLCGNLLGDLLNL